MVNVLLNRIKELEENLKEISKNNEEAKNEFLELFRQCKIPKEKKEIFKKRFLNSLNKIKSIEEKNNLFNENILKYEAFLEIIKNLKSGYLVLIDANYSKEIQKFILDFLINKIGPFFTINENIIIGLVDEKQYEKLKNIKIISYYNALKAEFSDIDLYKMFFEVKNYNFSEIEKAKKIFKEFRIRPAYKNKHYIEYSLIKDKIIDFEQEKLNKEKQKYAFIYDEMYPNLEVKLKREINNTPFVLAVLERIDKEMNKIKESKGLMNIVNRMLNLIEAKLNDDNIFEEVQYLRSKLLQKERL